MSKFKFYKGVVVYNAGSDIRNQKQYWFDIPVEIKENENLTITITYEELLKNHDEVSKTRTLPKMRVA